MVLLCVCLLEQGGPELVVVGGVHEGELAVHGGQTVVHAHLNPLAVLPEVKLDHARIVIPKAVLRRDYFMQ